MRKDHAYIEKATSLCLATTPRGHEYLASLIHNEIKEKSAPLAELLLFLEDEYLIIPNTSTVDDWVKVISSSYEEQYGCFCPNITRKTILKAMARGYMGVKLVIWD